MVGWEGHVSCPTLTPTRPHVPEEFITGVVMGAVLIIVLRGPYLFWARSGRSGKHLDSGRIFLHDRNFVMYSTPQKVTPL